MTALRAGVVSVSLLMLAACASLSAQTNRPLATAINGPAYRIDAIPDKTFTANLGLYRHLGFAVDGEETFLGGTIVSMSKPLGRPAAGEAPQAGVDGGGGAMLCRTLSPSTACSGGPASWRADTHSPFRIS
jgi:hypothetical protein